LCFVQLFMGSLRDREVVGVFVRFSLLHTEFGVSALNVSTNISWQKPRSEWRLTASVLLHREQCLHSTGVYKTGRQRDYQKRRNESSVSTIEIRYYRAVPMPSATPKRAVWQYYVQFSCSLVFSHLRSRLGDGMILVNQSP
jgi:hypothetical protein